jgi:hypothetical protein
LGGVLISNLKFSIASGQRGAKAASGLVRLLRSLGEETTQCPRGMEKACCSIILEWSTALDYHGQRRPLDSSLILLLLSLLALIY